MNRKEATGKVSSNAQKLLTPIEKELAELYSESFRFAEKELALLYTKLDSKITLGNAAKYGRLKATISSIVSEYEKLTGNVIKLTNSALMDQVENAFYGETWAVQETNQQIDFEIIKKQSESWGVINRLAVEAIARGENSGFDFIKTLKTNSASARYQIEVAVKRGIALGQGYKKTASSIKSNFEKGLSDSLRVVRTESGRCFTEAVNEAEYGLSQAGVEFESVWDATLDGRTREDHGRADGQVADSDGMFHVGGSIGPGPGLMGSVGQNINCRCRKSILIKGDNREFRRVGKEIIPYTKYSDWIKGKI